MLRAWVLAVLATWLGVAGVAEARPGDDPQRLGDPSSSYLFAVDPAVATAPGGRSVAFVAARQQLLVRRATVGRAFGPARPIAPRGARPAVATGDDLTALAWTHFDGSFIADPASRDEDCCERLRAATLDAGGRLGRPQELSAPGASVEEARVVVRGRRAAVAWQDRRGVRASTTRARGARFGPPKTLARPADQLLGVALPASTPHAFVLASTRVVEVWRSGGGRAQRRTLGRFAGTAYGLQVAVSPAGRLLLANTPRNGLERADRILVGYRRPGGRLRRHTVRLGRRLAYPPIAVALTATGRGLLVTAAGPTTLAIRSVDATGALGRPHTVRALGVHKGYPTDAAVALNPAGTGVLAALVSTVHGGRQWSRAVAWPLAGGGRPLGRRVLSRARQSLLREDGITATVDAAGRRRAASVEIGRDIVAARLR
jgi:hypothetical protein